MSAAERSPPGRLSRLARRWMATALAVGLTAQVVPGVILDRLWPDAFMVAAVLGLLSAVVRPLLVAVTWPLTVLTLGLFTLVIHGALLGLAAALTDGLQVVDVQSTLLGALVLSVSGSLLTRLFGGQPPRN